MMNGISNHPVVITGASGFVGNAVLKHLIQNKYEVIALLRTPSKFIDLEKKYGNNVKCLLASDSFDDLSCLLNGREFSIAHLATDYGRGNSAGESVFYSNVIFPWKLASWAGKNGLVSFLNTETFFSKADPSYPYLKEYVQSKRTSNYWLSVLSNHYKFKLINLSLEHVYGPCDAPEKFVTIMLQKMRENVPVIELTDGTQKRDFVHVEDVALAYIAVLKNLTNIDDLICTLEVGFGENISIKEFLIEMHKLTQSSSILEFGALPQRKFEMMSSVANISALVNLGWSPTIDIKTGINSIIKNKE